MKRTGNIFSKIITEGNIQQALLKASKGKKDRNNVQKVLNNEAFCIAHIKQILTDKTYVPSPYYAMKIKDGANKKERTIFKPKFFPDQIIHWALMLQITDIIERGMYAWTCASIKDRGISYGMKYLKKILKYDRKNTKYCLKLDIKKFYPSCNKEILKSKFRKIIKDKDTLWLIDSIIDSSDEGLPIGNYTSQWFANFYLQSTDHFIKEHLKIPYYIRYMDDMCLFHRNKKELRKAKERLEVFISRGGLRLKENWQLFKTDSRPVDLLGYRFYRDHVTLRRRNFLRIKRRVKKIFKKGRITYHDACAMVSYNGWLKHCDSHNYKLKYLKPYIDLKKCKGVIKNGATRKQYSITKFQNRP